MLCQRCSKSVCLLYHRMSFLPIECNWIRLVDLFLEQYKILAPGAGRRSSELAWRSRGCGGLQWRIQDFPEEGALTPKGGRQPIIWPIFPENCMKIKKFWARGGARIPHVPLRSATGLAHFSTRIYFVNNAKVYQNVQIGPFQNLCHKKKTLLRTRVRRCEGCELGNEAGWYLATGIY